MSVYVLLYHNMIKVNDNSSRNIRYLLETQIKQLRPFLYVLYLMHKDILTFDTTFQSLICLNLVCNNLVDAKMLLDHINGHFCT